MHPLFSSTSGPLALPILDSSSPVTNHAQPVEHHLAVDQQATSQSMDSYQDWQVRNRQVEVLHEEANLFLNQDDLLRALNCYDQALKIIPKHIPSLIEQVKYLLITRRWKDDVEETINFLYLHAPDDPQIIQLKVHWLIIHGKKEQALALIENLLEKNPNDIDAWLFKALAHITSTTFIHSLFDHSLESVFEPCQKALAIDANHSMALFILGGIYIFKDKQKSLEIIEKIGKKNPTSCFYLASMIGYLMESQQWEQVDDYINKSLVIHPNNFDALTGLAEISIRRKKWKLFDKTHVLLRQFYSSQSLCWQLLIQASMIRYAEADDSSIKAQMRTTCLIAHQKFLQTTCCTEESIKYLITLIHTYNSSFLYVSKFPIIAIMHSLYVKCLEQIQNDSPSEITAHYFRLGACFNDGKYANRQQGFFATNDAQKAYDCFSKVIDRSDTIIKEAVALAYFNRILTGAFLQKIDQIKQDYHAIWQQQLYPLLSQKIKVTFFIGYIDLLNTEDDIPIEEKTRIGEIILKDTNHPEYRLTVQKWKKQARRKSNQSSQLNLKRSLPIEEPKKPLQKDKSHEKEIKPRRIPQPRQKLVPSPIIPTESSSPPPPTIILIHPFLQMNGS